MNRFFAWLNWLFGFEEAAPIGAEDANALACAPEVKAVRKSAMRKSSSNGARKKSPTRKRPR